MGPEGVKKRGALVLAGNCETMARRADIGYNLDAGNSGNIMYVPSLEA